MALDPGTRFGPYEVVEPIGSGGMGEVYRAIDIGLKRDVALKVLPQAFVEDADRLARFQREAEILASLNHPNIATIHGLEQVDDQMVIVMELVEGPTLADRIAEGPLPPDEALAIARQIADALEAAHARQIIHRDLKPANIKVRDDGMVKVLDFGISKAIKPAAISGGPPVMTTPAFTQTGAILGTAAYMSPEQARGKFVDQRTDIWAFGCLLFEMLTGQPAFGGEDVAVTLARVLERDADTASLPKSISPNVRQALIVCLQKDVRQRVSHIGDVRLALSGAFVPDVVSPERGSPGWVSGMLAFCAFVGGAMLAAIAVLMFALPGSSAPRVAKFVIDPPAGTRLSVSDQGPDLAITRDGTGMLFLVDGQETWRLFQRDLGNIDAYRLVDAVTLYPFVSADGIWAAYYNNGATPTFEKVRLGGGPVTTIGPLGGVARGASWLSDDTFVYGTSAPDGLWLMPASRDGQRRELTLATDGGSAHVWPFVLPGEEAVVFTIWNGSIETAELGIYEFETNEWHRLTVRGTNVRGSYPRYSPSGHLVYAIEGGVLMALPFDVERLESTGNTQQVLDGVVIKDTGAANFDIASDGTLVYMEGDSSAVGIYSPVWVDLNGEEEVIPLPPRNYEWARISPDGDRVALEVSETGNVDIWIANLDGRGAPSRLTTDSAADFTPLWTPDGRRVAFVSDGDGVPVLNWRDIDDRREPQPLIRFDGLSNVRLFSWTPEGDMLFGYLDSEGDADLGIIRMGGEPRWEPLIPEPSTQGSPAVSPDGRWIVYNSNESGRHEIYLESFPELAGRQTLSTDGGISAVWSKDGRHIYYHENLTDRLMSVEFDPDSGEAQPARVLFDSWIYPVSSRGGRGWDFDAERQRFLVFSPGAANQSISRRVVYVQNWSEELKRLAPPD